MRTGINVSVTLLLFMALTSAGCTDSNEASNNSRTEPQVPPQEELGFPTSPVSVALAISGTPALGQVVEITAGITFNITGVVGAPPILLTSQIKLPEGFGLVEGELTKDFNLSNGETVKHKISVRAASVGDWEVMAKAESFEPYGEVGNMDGLYISVFEDTGVVSRTPPENKWISKQGPFSKNSDEIVADISLSDLPDVQKEVTLEFAVTPSIRLQGVQVYIVLPEVGMEIVRVERPSKPSIETEFMKPSGLNLIGDQWTWRGDIDKNETVSLKIAIKSVVVGEGYIFGTIRAIDLDGFEMVKTAQLNISVNEKGTEVTKGIREGGAIVRSDTTESKGKVPAKLKLS